MTEEQKTKRKPGLLVALVALLLIAGTVFGIGKYYENKRIQEMKDLIAMVPAPYTLTVDDISGSLFSRAVTLTGVKAGMPYKDETISLSIDKVLAESLNPAAFMSDGVHKLADKITVTGVQSSGPSWTYTVASSTAENVQGDFRLIAAEWNAALPELIAMHREIMGLAADATGNGYDTHDVEQEIIGLVRDHLDSLGGLIAAFETLRIGTVDRRDSKMTFAIDDKEVAVAVQRFQASDYSMTSSGPMKLTGTTGTFNGTELVTMEELGMQSFAMGEYAKMLDLFARDADPEALRAFFRENGFSMDGLFIKGMRLTIPRPGKEMLPVLMKGATMSLHVKGDTTSLLFDMDSLDIETRHLLGEFSQRERALMEPFLPKQTVTSFTMNMDMTDREDSLSDVAFSPLAFSVEGLGSLSVSAEVLGVSEQYHENQGQINALTFSLTDAGASDILFRIAGQEEDQKPEDLRAMAVMMVKMQGSSLPEQVREAMEHFAAFLETPGGAFSVSISPKSPVDPDDMGMLLLSDPDSLGITSSFTPGK